MGYIYYRLFRIIGPAQSDTVLYSEKSVAILLIQIKQK